ncbi:hypothetical protein BZG35_03850 [Brevundimonas sp. LM2]|nr:hypothetical protein BZG35_03850 [Brevundimonas sp. LM2]
MHVFSIAEALIDLGHDCLVIVPDEPQTVLAHGAHRFSLSTYAEALSTKLKFANGAGPDFIHAWTPRDHVREVVEAISRAERCPYLVHMEDNEEQILVDEIASLDIETIRRLPDETISGLIGVDHRSHPVKSRLFIDGAIGFTCLIETLLEFSAVGQDALTFWPGFDAAFAELGDRNAVRRSYDLQQDETVILYSGNVHLSIVEEIADLYGAVALLRRRGRNVRLVRTGWDYAAMPLGPQAISHIGALELGFIPRGDLPGLVSAADILVQPGKVGAFNDYRFPSKLPEFLASGRPVLLPKANIGLHLTDGENAFHLEDSGVLDIASHVERIMDLPDRGLSVGIAGRAFALENLTWTKVAIRLESFYRKLIEKAASNALDLNDSRMTVDRRTPQFPVDLIAFYLPQYHPIPENDLWWGKGFTEWTNVTRARPTIESHDQPRLPTDLGFYDLRLPEIMVNQAEMARDFGVSGFCFYYYWFDGRRLLEAPLDGWLAGGPDFPFCICWANEPWSRRWDGSNAEVLLDQTYGINFAESFISDILSILKDPRYIRVDEAPVLLIYKISDIPDARGAIATWRRVARENGIPEIHVVAVQSFGLGDPTGYGADAAVEFSPPHEDRMLIDPINAGVAGGSFRGYLEDYISVAMRSIKADPVNYVRYRGLFPRWDNTARRREYGHVFINDSAKAYGSWLRHLTWEALSSREVKAPLVFVNAWNEWAEGAYLEPDQTYGDGLLHVTRAALGEGVIDFVRGRTPARDRAFTNAVSILPDLQRR